MDPLIFLSIIVAFLLAIGVGGNDETFAGVVGSKRLTIKQAVIFGAIVGGCCAIIFGQNIALTINERISSYPLQQDFRIILIVLLSVAILLLLASFRGIPISTTHATIGAVVAVSLYMGGIGALNLDALLVIGLGWLLSPILGLLVTYGLSQTIRRLLQGRIVGLNAVQKKEYVFSNIILLFVIVTSFSRAANDVSNAIALIVPYFSNIFWVNPAFLIGAGGMALGLILLGKNVLKTISTDVVNITAESAFSAQASTAIILTWTAIFGIPISGTHVFISSLIGAGLANRARPNRDVVTRIALSGILTPVVSGILTLGSLFLLQQLIGW